jgi:hypothetical protein
MTSLSLTGLRCESGIPVLHLLMQHTSVPILLVLEFVFLRSWISIDCTQPGERIPLEPTHAI